MMNKEKNGRKNIWKLFLLLPVSALLIFGFACTEKAETDAETLNEKKSESYYEPVYQEVDVMPEYPGGFGELRSFVAKNLTYPKTAKDHGVAGRVMVQFVVDKNGEVVTDTKVFRIPGEGKLISEVVVVGYSPAEYSDEEDAESIKALKDEAVRVISMLPKFDSPAKKDGKPVAIAFTFPINFALQ